MAEMAWRRHGQERDDGVSANPHCKPAVAEQPGSPHCAERNKPG
jgi:hypothetical protein